jgi:hypothetical protein
MSIPFCQNPSARPLLNHPHASTAIGSSPTASPTAVGFMPRICSYSVSASMPHRLHHHWVHTAIGSTPVPRRPPPSPRHTFSTPAFTAIEVLPTLYLICYENIASVLIVIFLCLTYINDNMTSKLRNDRLLHFNPTFNFMRSNNKRLMKL